MRRSLVVALVVAAAPLEASAARAEDPCADDVKQLCPEVKPDSARVVGCLQEHEARLSVACREKLDADTLKARRFVEEFGRSCRADMDQFCAGVEPGGGHVFGCLAQHQLELSPSCQAWVNRMAEARERITAFRSACTADLERLCKGVPPQAGPLLECLQANEASLSSQCSAGELRRVVEAASLVDFLEEMTRQDRVREALQILQGIDSVAFSRSQVLLQFDSYQGLAGKGTGSRFLFNPQFVFGNGHEFALQVKVPVSTLYPYTASAATQSGLGDVITAFAWNFDAQGKVRQYLSLGLQWQTAAQPPLGAAWAVQSAYAVAMGLARWVSLTGQLVWIRSLGSTGGYPELDVLLLEPILVFNPPAGRSSRSTPSWDGTSSTGASCRVMKGMAGIFTDRQKSLSISAWYQTSLSSAAVSQSFQFAVGLGLAYYFDW